MFRSYRSVIFAVAGLAIVTLSLGVGAYFGALSAPHYGYQTEKAAYRRADTKKGNPSQIDRDRSGLPYFAERIASGTDPADGTEREKRDLAAQESMSVWTFWMLVASAISVVTTMIGTGFLLWQIMLTRKAVEDTGLATDAMREQNKIAREAMEKQLRAYVVVSYVEITHNKANPGHIQIAAHFQNVGETPATDLTASIFGKVLHGTQFRCDRTIGETSGGRSNLVLAKGSKPSVVSHSVELYHGLTASDVMNGDYSSFAFGFITYADVFGQRHETTFCFVTNPESRKAAISVIAAQDGNHCG